ncbi:MAG: NERD domain-containing protein [Gammaproteobacteria bacterium]|nr:NERD domain-containing protein [Gammaproteobacteria bacterium]NNC97174.1 NERD domain-containing protein [Gammaproteobacteria bacterium]NNM13633.1 NERD domain-containing protein [Gammaproteobacteria bacterium]
MTPLEITLSLLVGLLLLAVGFYAWHARKPGLHRKLKMISPEYTRHLVIPDGLDGHIELDYLLLTPHGLVVMDYREIHGTIFAGANLDLWTVLQDHNRFSIQNPFNTMRHRLNAVRGLVKDVPVIGLVVFPDVARFGNTPPENVIHESELLERFSPGIVSNQELLTKAFHQQYKILSATVGS